MLRAVCSEHQQFSKWIDVFLHVEQRRPQLLSQGSAAGLAGGNYVQATGAQFAGKHT